VIASAEAFSRKVASWSDLAALIEHFSYYNGHDWLFRGVTDVAHGLVPKVGREKSRKLKTVPGFSERKRVPYRLEDERAVLGMFRQQARAHLQSIPQTNLEWLAVAQHFGLPTRLLDWTDSLLVAAWFAVEKGGAKKTDSAIWVSKGVRAASLDEPGDPLDLPEPAVYRPPHISPRIAAQGSILMICPQPTQEVAPPFSAKIVIDREVEFTIKKRLNACGINRRHLFPDLAGLTEHLEWMYKNDWLTGYRERSTSDVVVADETKDEAVD
jgi:FRG domain